MRSVRRLLLVFLFCAFFVAGTPAVNSYLNQYVQLRYMVIVEMFAAIALGWAIVRTQRECGGAFPPGGGYLGHVFLLGAAVLLLLVYGFLSIYQATGRLESLLPVTQEIWVFTVLWCFLILGRYDEVWDVLEKPLILFFWLGTLLVLVSLPRPGTLYWGSGGGFGVTAEYQTSFSGDTAQRSISSLGYDIRGLMALWPLAFTAGAFYPRWGFWKVAGLLAAPVFAVFQIFTFRFRSELGMALALIVAVMLILLVTSGRTRLSTAILMLLAGFVCLGVVYGTTDFSKMVARFGEGDKWAFRKAEWKSLYDDTSSIEFLIGKGAGGFYPNPSATERMSYYRSETHMGVLFPFLKGGLLFCLIYFGLFFRLFFRKPPGWYRNRYNLAGFLVAILFGLSQIVIPFPTTQFTFSAVVAGLGLARLGTYNRLPVEEGEYGLMEPLPEEEYYLPALPAEGYRYDR